MSIRAGIYVRVSTDDQRDNGYSIDSQMRMIKEYCEKNNYEIIGVYDDAGHSGKDLIRPAMQKLLKDIKDHKLDCIVAVKTDRLSRDNFDGFWLLKYCEENDVKIELILEPYDISTANGEMMFGMNLVFGQRERKEIGARTKRALDEMALEKVHPAKAPFGYTRNKETGHLEINELEANSVRRVFQLCYEGNSMNNIAKILNKEHAYLNTKTGVWRTDRVGKILNNKIYIGIFEFGKYKRKAKDILVVEDYCEPIVDQNMWYGTRRTIVRNKHGNYGQYVHLFNGIVKCPLCDEILSVSESYKDENGKRKVYFHLRCKNTKCEGYGYHYNCGKIEKALIRVLDELTAYMNGMDKQIMIANTSTNKEIDKIDKAISKLEEQEKRLVDLYLESNINVDAINKRNDKVKKDIDSLRKQKSSLDPENIAKEYIVDIIKKYNGNINGEYVEFPNKLALSDMWKAINEESRKRIIHDCISVIEIERDEFYNITIKNIKFTEQFINQNTKEYIEYLYTILKDNNFGFHYEGQVDVSELPELEKEYKIFSKTKLENQTYSKKEMVNIFEQINYHNNFAGVIERPLIENKTLVDKIILIPRLPLFPEEILA